MQFTKDEEAAEGCSESALGLFWEAVLGLLVALGTPCCSDSDLRGNCYTPGMGRQLNLDALMML